MVNQRTTDENCVIVEGLIREDRRVRVRDKHCKKLGCNTSRPSERNTTVRECLNL
jgi:hypothetical protein